LDDLLIVHTDGDGIPDLPEADTSKPRTQIHGSADSGRARRPRGLAQAEERTVMPARIRNPLAFLFARSAREDYLALYVIRECSRGRPFDEVLSDPYVRNRSTKEERARLLDRPEVVAALGRESLEQLRAGGATLK
jgi:hypothetical protein